MSNEKAIYDFTEEYMRDIEPHANAIHAKCTELGISFVYGACYKQGHEEGFIHKSCNLIGPDKTPDGFCVASIAIEKGPMEAMNFILASLGEHSAVEAPADSEQPAE